MEQIDVFVLLFRAPDRKWSPQEVATALGMAPQSAGMRLFLLSSVGLLASAGSADVQYWYISTPALDALAKEISEAYESQRVALAAIVGGATAGTPAHHFADAFRVRKP